MAKTNGHEQFWSSILACLRKVQFKKMYLFTNVFIIKMQKQNWMSQFQPMTHFLFQELRSTACKSGGGYNTYGAAIIKVWLYECPAIIAVAYMATFKILAAFKIFGEAMVRKTTWNRRLQIVSSNRQLLWLTEATGEMQSYGVRGSSSQHLLLNFK